MVSEDKNRVRVGEGEKVWVIFKEDRPTQIICNVQAVLENFYQISFLSCDNFYHWNWKSALTRKKEMLFLYDINQSSSKQDK